jgi:sulfoxide reductase heme-binding subunit YedZ
MMGVFFALQSKSAIHGLSLASAYAGLAFLCASLVIGPCNVLRRHSNPVTTDLRRDVGIWACLLSLLHVVVGLQVHMRGKFWFYFFYPSDQPHFLPIRYDPFGFANFTGLGATLVLALLLALSNNLSLRRLGTRRWKRLQRWNYASFALVAVHAIVYQLLEKRELLYIGLFGTMVLMVISIQLAGFRRMRARTIGRSVQQPAVWSTDRSST